MDVGTDGKVGSRRHPRLLERMDGMLAAGQVSEAEAQQLRAAEAPSQFEDAQRDIRVRHARSSLDAPVEDGTLTRGEAERYLAGLRNGMHPRSVPAQLGRLRPRSRRSG
jgi:hypothetical protein